MNKMGKKKYGNVYEIELPNGEYAYICWIRQFSLAYLTIILKEQKTNWIHFYL